MFTLAVQRSCGALWPNLPDIPRSVINWISKHAPEKKEYSLIFIFPLFLR